MNQNTKFTDLLDLDRISFQVPRKEKIIIQLPTISTVLTPAVKSFRNWKKQEHKSSDQSDQKDKKLIESILQECREKQEIEEEMIDLDELEEFRELGKYGQIRTEFGLFKSLSGVFTPAFQVDQRAFKRIWCTFQTEILDNALINFIIHMSMRCLRFSKLKKKIFEYKHYTYYYT